MAHDGAHALCIGFTQLHPILSAAHFTGRNHFHRAGDLLSTLNTRDLGADFLADSHA